MSAGLLEREPSVINIGVESFVDAVRAAGAPVYHVDWRPPGGGEPRTAWTLALLTDDPDDPDAPGSRVDAANRDAVGRLLEAQPVLVDVRRAAEVWPDLGRTILHAGPPIEWARMCGPMRGAVTGAILYEGWASSVEEAMRLAARGEVRFDACHHFSAVGPMAGVISPSMPLFVVRNATAGNTAYSNLNEGLGKVLRFGAYGPEVIDRLRWMERRLAPALKQALATIEGGLRLAPIMAQALQMGDDVHNRNVAATSLLVRTLAKALLDAGLEAGHVREVVGFVDGNDHFFLNLSMAACKASLDAAHGVPGSSLVTAMSRNGVEFGIRVSGLGDRWFTAPAPTPRGLYFSGYSEADANPDLGDSAITETAGVGGFAMGAAPAMVQFVGGTPADALAYTREMYEITLARNARFTLPPLDFAGTPTGIDLRRVVDTGILPVINTGIAHREAGVGQIGAGIVRAPMPCFEEALFALADAVGADRPPEETKR
ncbi:MAG TPA: DUF1116 domain-containing protein [Thermodesulfobacteriota bacterium]